MWFNQVFFNGRRENLLPETRFLSQTRVCSARTKISPQAIVRLATPLFVYLIQWLLSKITTSSGTI